MQRKYNTLTVTRYCRAVVLTNKATDSLGETKALLLRSRLTPRPDPSEFDKPLTTDELADLARRLSLLSPYDVQQAYRRAHQKCCMQGELLPRAAAIQELVAATWRYLTGHSNRGLLFGFFFAFEFTFGRCSGS